MKKALTHSIAIAAIVLAATGPTFTSAYAGETKTASKQKIYVKKILKSPKGMYYKSRKTIYGPNAVKYNGPTEPITINGIN